MLLAETASTALTQSHSDSYLTLLFKKMPRQLVGNRPVPSRWVQALLFLCVWFFLGACAWVLASIGFRGDL